MHKFWMHFAALDCIANKTACLEIGLSVQKGRVCVKDGWITNRLTALEITPPDSTRGGQPFTQGKALSLAHATLHALTAPASEALFPVSPSPVKQPSMRKTLPSRLIPPCVLQIFHISGASGAGFLKYSATDGQEITWKQHGMLRRWRAKGKTTKPKKSSFPVSVARCSYGMKDHLEFTQVFSMHIADTPEIRWPLTWKREFKM